MNQNRVTMTQQVAGPGGATRYSNKASNQTGSQSNLVFIPALPAEYAWYIGASTHNESSDEDDSQRFSFEFGHRDTDEEYQREKEDSQQFIQEDYRENGPNDDINGQVSVQDYNSTKFGGNQVNDPDPDDGDRGYNHQETEHGHSDHDYADQGEYSDDYGGYQSDSYSAGDDGGYSDGGGGDSGGYDGYSD